MRRPSLIKKLSWFLFLIFLLSLLAVSAHQGKAYQEGPKQKCAICQIDQDLQGCSGGEITPALPPPAAEPVLFPLVVVVAQLFRLIQVAGPRAPPLFPSVRA